MKKYLLKKILDELMTLNAHLQDNHGCLDDMPWERRCEEGICQCKRDDHEPND